MDEKIRLGEQWYILATSSRADERRRVLKDNDVFAVFDRFGDIQPIGSEEEGLYRGDTCFLSQQELRIDGVRPMFLNSTVRDDNGLLTIELMNPDLQPEGENPILKGTLHIFRAKLFWNDVCYEHIRVSNFGLEPVDITLSLEFGASYSDIFEVRGFSRSKRGTSLPPQTTDRELLLGYRGLDGKVRKTRIGFDPPPQQLSSSRADYRLRLEPKEDTHLYLGITCEIGEQEPPRTDYFSAFTANNDSMAQHLKEHCKITTSNDRFNQWLDRSSADLVMLTTMLPDGAYPYAGLPWYSTTFGRDGILTAHECLWLAPEVAKGVLAFLAATQATEFDPARDAEPGKILHEARNGELAELKEIPFGRYYGTIDATPLFIGLAGAYHARTGDLDFIRSIWGNIRNALEWIDRYGDRDRDGFVEYERYTDAGLAQQGWKDSHDSVFHRDGPLADPPIALCEVQAYVYDARIQAARLAGLLGDDALKQQQESAAQALKKHFNEAFWCDEIDMYALALDGRKQQCRVPSSNAGHALWTGIATPEKAARISEQLVGDKFFCGWGIRTIPSGEARYNPMAYHNGSVWPHDNALIAHGMARYGLTQDAMKVFMGLWDTVQYMDQYRMPELLCGFSKRPDEGPTLYPVACSPQAWAAASVFYLLQSCLGLSFDCAKPEIRFRHPQLPPFLESAKIRDLQIGDAAVDLELQRYPNSVGINIERRSGRVEVVSVA
jgi:glycogen debranching enzyme